MLSPPAQAIPAASSHLQPMDMFQWNGGAME